MSEFNFQVGDRVDVYNEGTRIFKDLIIEHFNSDTKQVHFFDKDFTCHVDDIRHVKKPEPVAEIRTEYWVVHESDLKRFQNNCEKILNEGWTPIGGVSISQNGACYQYAQAFGISKEVQINHLPKETK